MKKTLDHLPLRKQAELRQVVETVRAAFEEATSTRRAARLKDGKILKIILYGSYARGDWVHDPVGRYFSDFDLLIIVDHEDLTDGEFWHEAENRTMPIGAARFDIAGDLIGRTALLGFWRRLFQTYSLFELHILKCVAEDDLVIAESAYLLAARRGGLLDVRAISVFEVEQGVITRWRDHADLAEVPLSEKDRWRRLSADRW